MQTTTNYGLKKPEGNEFVSVADLNYNADEIDKALKGLDNDKVDASGGDIANTKVSEFTNSNTQWPVPAAGEEPKTLWGKVKKFIEDFKNWMTGVCLIGQIVNNCVTDNPNLPLSAAQGKVLMDLYTVLNTNALKKSAINDVTGRLVLTREAGISGDSFHTAPLSIKAPYNVKDPARAMIGFENVNNNAGVLWLNIDGRLQFTDNNNQTKVIAWTDELV